MKYSLLASVLFLFGLSSFAQMVGPNAYIKGTSVELGINGGGGFEGVEMSASPPPAGMHPRSGTSNFFGFVANPQLNGWATFDGDFFTPGSSENGWGFEIGTSGVSASNNCVGQLDIPGTITNYSNSGPCFNVDWEGNATSGTDLNFKINYFLEQADLFYTTTVTVTNNTTATIPEIFYYRNLDPDNNVSINGVSDYATLNSIQCQPGTGASNVACVSATSTNPSSQPQSYLGLAGIGANFRVAYGGFSNRDASDIWNGVGMFMQTPGASSFADTAIALAYRIQNLAPNASHTFKFVVILDAGSATNIMTVTYPGSLPPQICDTARVDTIQNCGTPVPLQITGSTVGNYTWTWSPSTGLSTVNGPATVATPTSTVTYVATGTPTSPCVAPVPVTVQFVMEVIQGNQPDPVITPVPPVCSGSSPVALQVDSSGGVWSGPGVSGSGLFDPAAAGAGTHPVIYTIGSGPCMRDDTTMITVINSASAIINQPNYVCDGSAPFNLTAASSGGTWTGSGITNGTTGTFDPSSSGPGSFMVTYTIPGTCTAIDTAIVTVGSVTIPVTGFSFPTSPICRLDTVTLPVCDSGFTSGGSFSASPFGLSYSSSTGAVDPGSSTPGTYSMTYSVAATTCGPAGSQSTTIIIDPVIDPVTSFSYPPSACDNDSAVSVSGGTGFTPGGVYSATPTGLVINDTSGLVDIVSSVPGTYQITYQVTGVDSMCTASGSGIDSIVINPLPVIDITSEQTIWIGNSAQIIAGGGDVYSWSPATSLSCSDCDTTVSSPTESMQYCVTVTDSMGCIDSLCTRINIEIPCPTNRNLEMPNAFTPNGDGYNDELCLYGWNDCVSSFVIFIYDRWGAKVFESTDPDFCWDGIYKGRLLDPGVFVYFIKATYVTSGDTPAAGTSELPVSKNGNISIVH